MEKITFKWNIPNTLSLIRLLLLPVFVVLYLQSYQRPVLLYWSLAVLFLSGITDLFDGIIARRFNQITEVGKLLDPIVDKLTQITVLICVTVQHKELFPLAVICLIKETLQVIGGWILLSKKDIIRGSRWFGKISTFLFYAVILTVVFWKTIPHSVLITLILLVAVSMLFSFFSYMAVFFKLKNGTEPTEKPQTIHKENDA